MADHEPTTAPESPGRPVLGVDPARPGFVVRGHLAPEGLVLADGHFTPIAPAAVLGHIRDWNTLYGPFPGTDTALCGDETVIPGGGDCGPCRCVKHAGHVPPTTITEWTPDADHQCVCGDRWDDPTEPNTAEPRDGGW